ncbi:MAG: DUF177 domain-containing protein [Rikenellaceae bacterium]
MNRYKIAYKALAVGSYQYDFEVDNALFERMGKVTSEASGDDADSGEILGGECKVSVGLMRNDTFLRCYVSIQGAVDVECDRCLEPCSVDIDFEDEFNVKFSDSEELLGEWDGDVMWLPTGEVELDLEQYIYESIILDLPYQRVHPEGECNPEMLARFGAISSQELDEMEQKIEQSEADADVRGLDSESLERLRKLKESL